MPEATTTTGPPVDRKSPARLGVSYCTCIGHPMSVAGALGAISGHPEHCRYCAPEAQKFVGLEDELRRCVEPWIRAARTRRVPMLDLCSVFHAFYCMLKDEVCDLIEA